MFSRDAWSRFRSRRWSLLAVSLGWIGAFAEPARVARAEYYDVDWVRQFNATHWGGVSADGAGSVYLSGFTEADLGGPSAGQRDAFVRKYDAAGAVQWTRQLGSAGDEISYGASADRLGNVYIAGQTSGSLAAPNTSGDAAFVAKYDESGVLQWTRQLGGNGQRDVALGVFADRLGSVYTAGFTTGTLGGPNDGGDDAFISKYDASGDLQWYRQLRGVPHQPSNVSYDGARSVSADGLGNVYVAGYTGGNLGGSSAGGGDAFVSKFDAAGNLQWSRQWGTANFDEFGGVSADALGNVFVAGHTLVVGPQAVVGKYDAEGNLQWTRTVGLAGPALSNGYSFALVSADGLGNAYVSGYTFDSLESPREPNAGGLDIFVSKYDAQGSLQWTQQFGSAGHEYNFGVSADGSGPVYVSGYTQGSLAGPNLSGRDAFIARLSLSDSPPPPPIPGPRVAGVKIGGLTWNGGGYAVPDGGPEQLLSLPWTRINQVSITFDGEVTIPFDAVRIEDSAGNEQPAFGPIISAGPNSGEMTATWMLEDVLTIGDYFVRVADAVVNAAGRQLDGEWADGVSSVSGDGAFGGDFVYRLRVLPGDVNRDGVVNIADWAEVRDRRGATPGSPAFSIFHDIDRRGAVDRVDFDFIPRNAFTSLPPLGLPAASDSAAVPEPATHALVIASISILAFRRLRRSVS